MPVLLLLAVAVFAQGTSEFVLAGLLPGLAADLGVSLARAGWLTSAFALGIVIGAPVMAVIGRRVSPRWTLAGCLAAFIVVHALGAMTDSFGFLLVTRIVAALANAGFLAVTLATVPTLVAPERRTWALSVILGGTTLALVAGVPVGALIGDVLGWRATLWGIALLCMPVLVIVLLVIPARPESADPAVAGPTVLDEVRVLGDGVVRRHVLCAVLVNAGTFGTFTYLVVIGVDAAGIGDSGGPALLAVFGIGAFLGVSAAGRWGDRSWRLLITVTGPLLAGGWLLMASAVAHPFAFIVLTFVQGALSFALGSTLIARIVITAERAPTMGGAFATAALNVGALLGPVGGGVVLHSSGPRGPLILSALFVGGAVFLARRR